jgi:lipopolysaccharide/colanic/teichoic acid biosynthesis glycosyltransferase
MTDVVKRAFDLIACSIGLLLLWPVLLAVGLWVRLDAPGDVLFRQQRVGRGGRIFRIHKFRTMYVQPHAAGPLLTATHDARITRAGATLRRWKLDELPQLLDVLAGTMSLAGPRPEVPCYVERWTDEDRRVILSVRPGITDLASLRFRNEGELLRTSVDPETTYLREIMPEKIRLNRDYVERQSLWLDVRILIGTVAALYFARQAVRGVVPERHDAADCRIRPATVCRFGHAARSPPWQ